MRGRGCRCRRDGTSSPCLCFATSLRSIFDLGVGVTLIVLLASEPTRLCVQLTNLSCARIDKHAEESRGDIYLVSMSEPGRPFLFTADQRYPFATASAKTFPYVKVSFCATSVLGALERSSGCRADTMREGLVIPKCTVLQNKPTSRLAKTTPSFALVAMPAHPSRRVQVAIKSKVLLVGHEVWIGWVHV